MVGGLEEQAESELRAIRINRNISAAMVFAVIAAAYGLRGADYVFLSALLLFVQQVFASVHHTRRLVLSSAAFSARAGLPARRIARPWLLGAAVAVRESYFVLFLCFDTSWLLHAYAEPVPALSGRLYLDRLAVGPLSGLGLVAFTLVFWIAYAGLFVFGGAVASEPEMSHSLSRPEEGRESVSTRIPFSVGVSTRAGRILLNGHRLPRAGASAVILLPGFTQSALIYDLFPGSASLAEHLWGRGYDVWMLHPRGTGESGGRCEHASLDDYAAADIPAIIAFVAERVPAPPILVGHSQGGITSLLCLMGVEIQGDGTLRLSDAAASSRQEALGGLVAIGAFPSFVYEREAPLQRLVRRGFPVLGVEIPLGPLLRLVRPLAFLGVPISARLRRAMTSRLALRVLLFPVSVVLEIAARLPFWEFLYHIPNVTVAARRQVFFATIEGTFTGILEQYYRAIHDSAMRSSDGAIDYSNEYGRLHLPISFVSMELDGFVDEPSMIKLMFDRVSSQTKFNAYLPGVGHEDIFMIPACFPQIYEAINKLILPR